MTTLAATCLTRDQANAYIVEHHRHHGKVSGHRFIVGALNASNELVGVMVAGRPRARLINQYRHVEVNRLCTDGAPNVCSFLYARVSRVARDLGFASVFTSILESESGASLKAAGWGYAYTTKGGSQDRPSRRRTDKSPTEPKQVWCPVWCLPMVRTLNAEQSAKVGRKNESALFREHQRTRVHPSERERRGAHYPQPPCPRGKRPRRAAVSGVLRWRMRGAEGQRHVPARSVTGRPATKE